MTQQTVTRHTPYKNPAFAALLTLFFGPFGYLYVSVRGGLIWMALCLLTVGLLAWPVMPFVAVARANRHNRAVTDALIAHDMAYALTAGPRDYAPRGTR